MFRKKKGNSSGKILGWIVLIAWVFFFLKYSIGYVMFRYQIKTYSPVIATVTDYHKNKIETVGEEGQREVDYNYTVNIQYTYNSMTYGSSYTQSYKPTNDMITIYVNPNYPSYYIFPQKGKEQLTGLIVVLSFLVIGLIAVLIQRRNGASSLAFNGARSNMQNGINVADGYATDGSKKYIVNLRKEKTEDRYIPKFSTDFEKSGETLYLNQHKKEH